MGWTDPKIVHHFCSWLFFCRDTTMKVTDCQISHCEILERFTLATCNFHGSLPTEKWSTLKMLCYFCSVQPIQNKIRRTIRLHQDTLSNLVIFHWKHPKLITFWVVLYIIYKILIIFRIKPRLNSIAVSSSGNSNNALHHWISFLRISG